MKINIASPTVLSVLDISTIHISPADGILLSEIGDQRTRPPTGLTGDPVIYDYGEGAFVSTYQDEEQVEADLPFPRFSPEFNAIMRFALENGHRFVKFDGEGETYPELPEFDW